jgi:AcrR family transcriptional regulator
MSRNRKEYQQTARAEAAAETRQRILAATRELLAQAPLQNVALPEIAARAGVARSTIYTSFGSREGLFVALAEDLLWRGGFDRLGEAFRHPDARVALESSVREAARLYKAEYAVGRALLALAAVDADAARAAARLNQGRPEGMLHLARRLHDQGALRAGLSVSEAADILWVLTGFETFFQLHVDRGLPAPQVAERLIAMARRLLLKGS